MRRSRSVQAPLGVSGVGRIVAVTPFGEICTIALPIGGAALKVAEDVLDQDDRRIDDDAEVDGADRQQVGILAAHHQNDDAEEQRKRNVDADDDGAAQVAEKDPLDQKNQNAAEDEIVQHRSGRHRNQHRAIVKRHELYARPAASRRC